MMTTDKKTGLALLREPFSANQISKLPKPTKSQTDQVKDDFKVGIRCGLCGAWHHKDVVHLDYVGHAALTDRLLDCDPNWNWKPLSISADGSPATDKDGGMWIELTVCGVSRIGYGDAEGKTGGNAVKERIGDALRNAAMRFGAALDLWHKGDLHVDDEPETKPAIKADYAPVSKAPVAPLLQPPPLSQDEMALCVNTIGGCTDYEALKGIFGGVYIRADEKQKVILTDFYNVKKALLTKES